MTTRTRVIALAAYLLSLPSARPAAAAEAAWKPLGLSGGGAMFAPAVSPADRKRMIVHCDMSAAYITRDGGRSWRMIHHARLQSNIRCRPVFHPTDPDVVLSPDGWDRIAISRDSGETWSALATLPDGLCGEIALDPGNPDLLFVGAGERAYRSTDGGRTWAPCSGVTGAAVGFHVDQTTPSGRRVCFAATAKGVWRSDDGGGTWAEKSAGLPWRDLRGFAGASNAKEKAVFLYCTIPSRAEGGTFVGGVYVSADRGERWTAVPGEGLNRETAAFDEWAMGPVAQYHAVLAANAKPRSVWAFNSSTGVPPPHHAGAYRSDDAGGAWRPTFQADPRWKPCNVEPDYTVAAVRQFYQDIPGGAAVNPADPDHVVTVDGGRCHQTRDGGRTWTCGHTQLAPGQDPASPGKNARWICNGLVVTTAWNFYTDPFEPARHYIAYTDIGFARSLDAGKTWLWWEVEAQAPWRNTCYELAFDPEIPGRIWGAFSNVHDIPNGNIVWNRHRSEGAGGVCVSADFGASWKASNAGLPEAPVTSIVLDPKSPRGARVLYAGVFGRGVYRSDDDGKTWSACGAVGAEGNRRVCRVVRHLDSTLFALVTARVEGRRFLPEGVGLHRSKDGGRTWAVISRGVPSLWPKDFTVDAKDSRVIWLGACDTNGEECGGLYRTSDGGAGWRRLAREGPEHFGAYPHPRRPGWLYMTLCEGAPGAGLWLSRDGGATFKPVDGLPFRNVMRAAFDRKDDKRIRVTTFGGSVWEGPGE